MLDPAPAPEDRRGDAVAGGRPRSCARSCARAAVAAARAVGYVGAGTVEFLLDAGRRVLLPGDEHPAAGRAPGHRVRLRRRPGAAAAAGRRGRRAAVHRAAAAARARDRGAAVRRGPGVRLAARAPARCTGSTCPAWPASSGPLPQPGLRLDSGVRDGSVVGVHYDPMLAKLDRLGADPARGRPACSPARWPGPQLHGVATNRDLLVRVLRHPAFLAGDTDTGVPRPAPGGVRAAAVLGGRRAAVLPGRRAGRRGRRRARPRRCWPRCRRAGATCRPARRPSVYDGPAGPVEVGYRLDRARRAGRLVGARGRPGRARPGRARSGAGHRRPPAGRGGLGRRRPGRARRRRHPARVRACTGSATCPMWTARRARWR